MVHQIIKCNLIKLLIGTLLQGLANYCLTLMLLIIIHNLRSNQRLSALSILWLYKLREVLIIIHVKEWNKTQVQPKKTRAEEKQLLQGGIGAQPPLLILILIRGAGYSPAIGAILGNAILWRSWKQKKSLFFS